jgi:transposase
MSIVIASHEIEIVPESEDQITYFKKACGVSRFAYNWGLSQWEEQSQQALKPNWMALKKQLNSVKKEQFPWMLEVTKCAVEGALADLGTAYSRFFKKKAKKPQFKKKGKSQDSFYLANDQFTVTDKIARLPHIGNVKLREALRFEGKPDSGSEYVSIFEYILAYSLVSYRSVIASEEEAVDFGLGDAVGSDICDKADFVGEIILDGGHHFFGLEAVAET